MLKLRILTAAILACLLLAGLFVLAPKWTVLAFGAVFTYGAWEWAGFGAWRAAPARLAYACGIALLLLLSGYNGYAGLGLAVAISAAINLL